MSPNFSETLYYQDKLNGQPSYYNGNISATTFGDGNDKLYYFNYDKLNRLRFAYNSYDQYCTEYVGNYDKNGDVQSIYRSGDTYDRGYNIVQGPIDDLTLTYNGNQLKSVSDAVDQSTVLATNDFVNKQESAYPTEYLYDANGNLYADLNKGMAFIRYNYLNLPQKVQFRNGTKNEYLYYAVGVKRRASYNYSQSSNLLPLGDTGSGNTLAATFQIDYCGNYVYEKNGTGAQTLKRILTPEGYLQTVGGTTPLKYTNYWSHVYFLKDHLGNTRVKLTSNYLMYPTSTSCSASGQIDYYPFGMERTTGDPRGLYNSGYNPYLYYSKEIDRVNGLDMLDYGARWRDPAIGGVWPTLDALAENHFDTSPYAFCGNNPVNRIDPDGMDWFQNNQTGDVAYVSSLRQGAEKDMEKGWQWMGENDMFKSDKDDIANSDQVLALQNGGNIQTKQNDPFTHEDDQMVVSMLLKGDKATDFMKDRGYDFKPTQQIRFENEIDFYPESGITAVVGQQIFITEKSGYVPRGAIEDRYTPVGKIKDDGFSSVGRYQISYTTNAFKKGLNSLMPYVGFHDLRIPVVYSSLRSYKWNNGLINKFLNRQYK